MPYNQLLAKRLHEILKDYPGCIEKKMFGGIGYILNGNMACGIQGNDLIVRVGIEKNEAALNRPNVRPFMGVPGKPMAGWILVAPEGVASEPELRYWVELGYQYVSTLPIKPSSR